MLTPGIVCVIIPTYNDAFNLKRCLEALKKSIEERPIEIYVVDDASTDNTKEVAESFGVHYLRNQTNRGPSFSRNRGVLNSSSDYVLFVDSDVEVPENCFAVIQSFLLKSEDSPRPAGLQGCFSLQHPHKNWSSLIYNTIMHLHNRGPGYGQIVNTSLLLLSRKVIHEVGPFCEELRYLEDNEFGQRMRIKGKFVKYEDILFIHHKKMGWQQLIYTMYHSGVCRQKIKQMNYQDKIASEIKINVPLKSNSLFFKWLLASVLVMVNFALIFSSLTFLTKLILCTLIFGAVVGLTIDLRALYWTKRNILFVICSAPLMIFLPWPSVVGIGMAKLNISKLKKNQ